MKKKKLIARDFYLNKLISFKDTDMIKVITGIRRCGKSSLMGLMQEYLVNNGISENQIISMNFESMAYSDMNVNALYKYVTEKAVLNELIAFCQSVIS